jgi:serine/threonine protein kinase
MRISCTATQLDEGPMVVCLTGCHNPQDHILFERNALAALSEESKECVFAVMLYRTLQTPDSVLFVTEYIPGGELYSYIRNDGVGLRSSIPSHSSPVAACSCFM